MEAAIAVPPDETDIAPEHSRGPRIWPRVVGVLILLVGAGGAWIWQNPGFVQKSLLPGLAGHEAEADRFKALDARLARLEQRPVPMPVDLGPLNARLDALEKRAPAAPETIDLRPLLARLDALETREASPAPRAEAAPTQSAGPVLVPMGPDLRPLLARLEALETRETSPAPRAEATPTQSASPVLVPMGPDLRPLLARLEALEKHAGDRVADPGKMDAISSRVDALSSRDPAADVRARLDDLEHNLSGLAAKGAGTAEVSERAARLARLEAAAIALAAGRALGPIPDAPPALTRFATTLPPTEAAIRLAFPAAAQAALKVSKPDTEGKSFLESVLARLQDVRLITVREGDHVLIGNSAVSILARARVLLDAGDVNGAAQTVATLSGPPAGKMAPWLDDAKALAAAREALASLAGNG